MNLTEMRTRVREDLQDTDAANYRWTNDEVDGAIQRVVREFSLAYPQMESTTLATTDGSREIDISSLSGLIAIMTVEFPIGADPTCYQHFELWKTTLYMQDKGNGDDARVLWYKEHTLAESSTIPTQFEEIIVLGATGYLAASASAYTVDRASIAGKWATINFLKWGQERLELYEKKLKAISRNNRIISKEFYTDA
jgi:hypothetical protein